MIIFGSATMNNGINMILISNINSGNIFVSLNK